MKRTLALKIAGAAALAAAVLAAPQGASAQVGISVGFGSGYGYGWGGGPGWLGVGFSSPVAYYGGYRPVYAPYYAGWPGYYAPPVYRVVRRPVVVSRTVYPYAEPVHYAPRPVVRTTRIVTVPRRVVRTRIVTAAPRYVTRRVVTVSPEIRRTRVVRRVYY